MGKAISVIKHPFRNFNLENRAHKVISQPKPTPAPKHEKDRIYIDQLIKDYPQAYKDSLKKNEELDKHLKSVYVTSKEPNETPASNPQRSLPQNRSFVEEFEYGTKEPKRIPLGKTTLRNALDFITKNQSQPEEFTAKKIAEIHSLSEERVRDILKHFRIFEVYNRAKKSKATFAGPSLPSRLTKQKVLPAGHNSSSEKT